MDATKAPESQTSLLELSEAAESSNFFSRLNGTETTIDATGMTTLNLELRNNGTTVIGDQSQLNICKRCLPRQRGSQSKSAESGAFSDGKGTSSQIESTKRTKPKRKRKGSSKVQTTSNEDGNFADGENSDSDNADKLQDFLQSDSDD